jgi:hypothetical protein
MIGWIFTKKVISEIEGMSTNIEGVLQSFMARCIYHDKRLGFYLSECVPLRRILGG